MPLTIPTTPAGPLVTNPRMLLLYGAPKVGKTTLFDQAEDNTVLKTRLDNPLMLDLEHGSAYITVRRVTIDGWNEFVELCKLLRAQKEKYLVVDTIDKLEELCEIKATLNYKNSNMGSTFKGESVLELAQGYGYRWLREAFHDALDLLSQCAETVIYIGHIRDKNLTNGAGAVMTIAKDLDLAGKVRNIACARADAIGYLYRDPKTKDLCANFATMDDVNCGSRCKQLRGVDLKPFSWGKVFV